MEFHSEDLGGMYVETADGAMFQVSVMDLPDSKTSLKDAENISQLHTLEKSAYTAVLRAFCAQSNALSWGKEGLITELRKELRVSDIEHRQILAIVSTDKSIKLLRERSKDDSDVAQEDGLKNDDVVHVDPKRKKLVVGTRSALAPIPDYVSSGVQAQIANKAALNKNQKDYEVRGTGGSFSARPCMHATPTPVALVNEQIRYPAPARVPAQGASKSINRRPHSVKKRIADTIHIQKTDMLIKQIKEACSNGNTNPAVVENAKHKLMDQEKALLEAISVLDDASDSEEPPKKTRKRGHITRHHSMSSLCT